MVFEFLKIQNLIVFLCLVYSKLFLDFAPLDLIKDVRGESLNILTTIGLGELLLFSSLLFLFALAESHDQNQLFDRFCLYRLSLN
jgi:hypothetical protein